MKKLPLLLVCLALGGCAGVGGVPTSTAEVSERAKQIQAMATTLCRFVPTIGTIAAIISGGTTAPIAAIASDICLAVTTAPLADGPARVPRVNGVIVRGRFV